MKEKPSSPGIPENPSRQFRAFHRILHKDESLSSTTETPPQIPQFNDAPIDERDTIAGQARLPWWLKESALTAPSRHPRLNQADPDTPTAKRAALRSSSFDEADLDIPTAKLLAVSQNHFNAHQDEISAYTTLKLPAPALAATDDVKKTGQPTYDDASYNNWLARYRKIDEKKLSWQDLRQFSQFVTPFKWQIALAFFLTVAVGLTALPLPFIFNVMLDQVFPRRDGVLLAWTLAILLVVLLLAEVLSYLNRNVVGLLSRSANLKIVFSFYRHMLSLPLSFYQGLSSTGQVLSRLNEVTSAQQTVIQVLIDTCVNSVLTIIYMAVLFFTNWQLTLAVVLAAPFYIGISLYFNRRIRHYSRQVVESYAVMSGAMYEGLTALKTIKALTAEHRFGRKTKKLVMQTNELSFKRTVFQSEAKLAIGIVQALCTIAILSFGGYLVLTGAITAGALAAFILILRQLSTPVMALNGSNQQIQASAVAIDRLFEILNYPKEAGAGKGVEIGNLRGRVSLEHVHFSYVPGTEVLHDINLDVKPGTTIAFVGRSGAGKTTIANLLMRFYLPASGRISIDGYDLRDLKIESLRSQFGVILQDDSLFSGTIEDNLTFGLLRKISYAELEEAARNANILSFIQSQPLGFKTMLHERGQDLSGGQRQRIAIARMFLRQPKILIMDEPSSALDNESEQLIQQALKRLTQGRTTFIIAHRLSTIRNADRIVVIDNGSVVEQGTHEELLARKGIYWHLYNSYGRM